MRSVFFEKLWYGTGHPLLLLLRPCAWIFQAVAGARRWLLRRFYQENFSVPVVVVGNITVGGVGKTPLVLALAKQFQEKGLRVGIVSRGYKARIAQFPHEVRCTDTADLVGDEPLLLAKRSHCPVVIDPNRSNAVRYLLEKYAPQIIVSDDGLQHYRMGRAIEIAVMDGMRGLGNGLCLPAGPLRESAARLRQVDFIVVNQGAVAQPKPMPNAHTMVLKPGPLVQLTTQKTVSDLASLPEVAAVAGIGNPQRFYSTLSQLGIQYQPYTYPDHYQYKVQDLQYAQSHIVMTEKDAVKCVSFHLDKIYYLPVDAVLDDAFWQALWSHTQLIGYR